MTAALTAAALLTATPTAAGAAPQTLGVQGVDSVKGSKVKTVARPGDLSQGAGKAKAAPAWPAPGDAVVSLDAAGGKRAGNLPVTVDAGSAAARTSGAKVKVSLVDRAATPARWRDGVVLKVARADAAAAAVDANVSVDYGAFANAYGAGWASRLRLVALPACALTTPDAAGCATGRPLKTTHDAKNKRISATVAVSGGSAETVQGASAATAPTGGLVLAMAAGASGSEGDYSATSLQASSTWSAGGNSGDFAWTYPMRSPPGLGGPTPQVTLAYSSSSVDGRSETTNNQPSQIGEGFEYWPGYIERRYAPCADDKGTGANNSNDSGDQCWATDNANMSLNGAGGELVRDGASGVWKVKGDDNSKIERLTNTVNGDNNNEYWRVTTADGNQYYFGLNRLPGYTGTAPANKTTNSAWTVPVAGNHSGEPCHATGFTASFCAQAWRWNLDYVVDKHGNTMSMYYNAETNKYGRYNSTTDVQTYTRGGTLARIDYGTDNRSGTDTANTATKPPMTVVFGSSDRCLASCSTHNAATWPDTPWDQECTGSPCTDKHTPTFWSTKRLTSVTTRVWDAALADYRDVDTWTMTHTFPDPGDGTRAGLWLETVKHTGKVGGTQEMPEFNFDWIQMPNRVDTFTDGKPAMNWMRMGTIWSDAGAKIDIRYTAQDCVPGTRMPSSPAGNTLRCYPVLEKQWDKSIKTEYFHKYLVKTVTQADCATATGPNCTNAVGAPDVVTSYDYVGNPGWRHTDDDGITKDNLRTWSDFRGYRQVDTRVGEPTQGQQTLSRSIFFRGMYGDKNGSGGTRTDALPAIDLNDDGDTSDTADAPQMNDEEAFGGTVRSTTLYNGVDTAPISVQAFAPWQSSPTATRTIGSSTTYARHIGTATTWSATVLAPGNRKVTRADSTFDSYGMETQLANAGDLAVSTDDTCKKTTYHRNTGANLLGLAGRVEVYALPCGQNPATEADVVSDTRTSFDGQAYGAAPTVGETTRTERAKAWTSGGGSTWITTSTFAYDAYGRETDVMDQRGNHSLTAYTPASGGPVTRVTKTTATGWTSTEDREPAWGKITTKIDVNGRRTDLSYDPLGRLAKVWLPNHLKASFPTQPSSQFTYLVRNTGGLSAVTSQKLNANSQYVTTHVLYDGLLRSRQTQQLSKAAGNLGTVFTETKYDAAGRTAQTSTHFDGSVQPSTTFFTVLDWQPKTQSVTEYDRANRVTAVIVKSAGQEKWRTTTIHGGDRTSVVPPQGGTATTTLIDGTGRTTEVRQYHDAADVGSDVRAEYDRQIYHYDRRGNQDSITDNAGNVWSFEFNLLGRQTKSIDPDKGVSTAEFNDGGDLLSTTDSLSQTLSYTYDTLGRKTGEFLGSTSGTKLASWAYDPSGGKGQLASSSRWVGADEYKVRVRGYTPMYLSTGEDFIVPASTAATGLSGTYSITRTYKVDGSVATLSYPNVGGLGTETLTYTYDDATGQPEQLQTNVPGLGQYVSNTDYTAFGETSFIQYQTTGGAWLQRGFTYDDATRRLSRAQTIKQNSPQAVTDVNYTYDGNGSITKIADLPAGLTADQQCFTYDHVQRLTDAWTPSSGECADPKSASALGGPAPYWQSWTFDAAGNRKTQIAHAAAGDTTATYAYPATGSARPHAVTGVAIVGPGVNRTDSYSYDTAGNTTVRPNASGGTQNLEWDPEGKLAKVTIAGAETSHVYTAEGTRLIRRDAATTTLYLPGQEVQRNNTTGAVTATRYYQWGGQDCAMVSTGGPLTWLVTDTQGTQQVSVVAGSQAVVQRRQTPFGGPRGTVPTWPNGRGFVGGDNDASGLTHVGAREYDPTLGRFISVDPVFDTSSAGSLTAYSYANNSPVTQSDPTGMDSCFVCYIPGFSTAWKATVYTGGKVIGGAFAAADAGARAVDNGLAIMSSTQGGMWTAAYQAERQITTSVMGTSSDPSAIRVGWEWASGTGPKEHHLHDDSRMAKDLQDHSHVQKAREMIATQINKSNPEYTPEYTANGGPKKVLSRELGAKELFKDLTGNTTAFFLGSYNLSWTVDNIDKEAGTATVTFTVENESDMNSATHTAPQLGGYTKQWDQSVGNWVNDKFRTGPGSPKYQKIQWTETIVLKKPAPPVQPVSSLSGFFRRWGGRFLI